MKTVVEGVLQANLPWGLVLAGASLSIVATLLGIPALPFAVGIYLPASAMMPVFLGGCLRSLTEWLAKRNDEEVKTRTDKGVLLGSGLIAGEGLVGVAVAIYGVKMGMKPPGFTFPWSAEPWFSVVAAAALILLGWFFVTMTKPSK
jgi:uncharacterized oligopeptide transporter (OPT) family protein